MRPAVRYHYLQALLAIACVVGVLYYLFLATEWTAAEVLRVAGGVVALWGPGAVLLYLLLRNEVASLAARLTLSVIGSYALTTLVYFGCAVLGLEPLFYGAQLAIAAGLVVYAVRNRAWARVRLHIPDWTRVDWILPALIVGTLVICVRYQQPYQIAPATGDRTFVSYGDQTYFVSQMYELDRHIPPIQQSTKAGVPERAYHIFPHVTTLLLARYTGQPDFLRASMVYHYAIVEILLCLALFYLVRTITGSRWGGYMGVAWAFLLAIPFPPLMENGLHYYYPTLYPNGSNGADATLLTAPQMLGGLVVMYGIFLALALASARLRRKVAAVALFIFLGMLVGAMTRFRAQIILPLLPSFLLLAFYARVRTGRKLYLVAGGLALLISVLLALEMLAPVYLPGTARLYFGYNGLTMSPDFAWVNVWPGSTAVFAFLHSLIPNQDLFQLVWQVVSLSAFVLFDMLGLPLLLAAVVYLRSKPARREWALLTALMAGMVILSLLGGMWVGATYDLFSVGGEMLLHINWYLLPLLGVSSWMAYRWLRARWGGRSSAWLAVGGGVLIAAFVVQCVRPPSVLQAELRRAGTFLSANEWQAIHYLRYETPTNAVVLSNEHPDGIVTIFSGLAGRAVYLEYGFFSVHGNLQGYVGSPEERTRNMNLIWSTADVGTFCRTLTATPATYLVEFADHPLQVHAPSCVQRAWVSTGPGSQVTIWQVTRD